MALPSIARAALALVVALLLAPAALAAEPGDMTLGDPKAKVTVVEYASITCPHCARFNNEVFPAFKAKYVDTGKVLYVFREFPTQPVEVAAAGFLVARCAPPARYFTVIDSLFRTQAKLYETGDARKFLFDAAKVGGLSEAQAQACLEDKARLEAFNGRVQTALETAGIEATPTFVIGAARLQGDQSLAALSAVIDPLLAAR